MDIEEMHKAYERAMPSQPVYENIDIDKEIIKRWLASKRTTLWSIWAITDEEGRENASEWFYKEIDSLIRFTMSESVATAS